MPERSDGDDPQVRNLAAVATDLLERAAAAPAGRAALTLAAGAGAPLKQTMLALQSGEQLAEHDAPGAATLQVVRGRVRLVTGRCGSDSSGELTRSRKVFVDPTSQHANGP